MSHDLSLLPLLLPLIIMALALLIFCLFDLFRRDRRVKGGNKLLWLLVILLGNTVGQLIYLFVGREED
jgi:ABC-type spermidine/putrescine transport system permease subunit II